MIAQQLETPSREGYGRRQRVGLVLGPTLLGLVCALPTPAGLTPQAKNLVALIALMAVWWMTEAVPLAATSLLPLVLLPVLGIMKPEAAAAPYADPNIFLFLGGFLLAQAFQKWELHRRVALLMLTVMGTRLHQLLLGCILATAVISMWVSNTATAMMMLPIGMAVASQVGVETSDPHNRAVGDNFKAGLMLGIACAASIGGMATLIGTPPNVIFAGQVRQLFPELGEVGFLRWMLVGVPLAGVYLLMLPATLAASCGFMLPVATPPSAVALASGYVAALQMMRVGLVLDVLGAIVVTLAVSTLGRAVFALD